MASFKLSEPSDALLEAIKMRARANSQMSKAESFANGNVQVVVAPAGVAQQPASQVHLPSASIGFHAVEAEALRPQGIVVASSSSSVQPKMPLQNPSPSHGAHLAQAAGAGGVFSSVRAASSDPDFHRGQQASSSSLADPARLRQGAASVAGHSALERAASHGPELPRQQAAAGNPPLPSVAELARPSTGGTRDADRAMRYARPLPTSSGLSTPAAASLAVGHASHTPHGQLEPSAAAVPSSAPSGAPLPRSDSLRPTSAPRLGSSPSVSSPQRPPPHPSLDRPPSQAGLSQGSVESNRVDYKPRMREDLGYETKMIAPSMPSAVTVGGVPVATDGDLVYLGGGLYASVARDAVQEAAGQKKRPRALPGRTRPPPRQSAAARSSSAHAASLSIVGEDGSGPSRPRSDGQLPGLGSMLEGTTGPASAPETSRAAKEAPRHWRPSGPAKLPPPPQAPAVSSSRAGRNADADDVPAGAPGRHSDHRREERRAQRLEAKEQLNLFGPSGILKQLADPPQEAPRPQKISGPPRNSDARLAERQAMKEAKVEALLNERASRLESQRQASAVQKHMLAMQRQAHTRSAPDLTAAAHASILGAVQPTKEEIEQQKLRLACKMEIMDFFNGYGKSVGAMSKDQTKVLLQKLNGSVAAERTEEEGYELNGDVDEDRWTGADWGDHEPSIQERLRQVSESCNRVFECTVEDDDPFDDGPLM